MKETRYWKEKFKGVCDVEKQYQFQFKKLLDKASSIFKWENLPDSVNEQALNSFLLLNGFVIWFKVGDELFALNGDIFGVSPYYEATNVVIANPVLGSMEKEIYDGKKGDCVVMYNSLSDHQFPLGLYPLLQSYATLLADNLVSINTAQINTRVQAIAITDSNTLKNSAETALKQLYAGKPYTCLTQELIDKVQVNPLNANAKGQITELVELNNYITANFLKELGVYSNDVRKRERLIVDEVDTQKYETNINIFSMLKERVEGIKKVNELFGTDITVRVNEALFSDYEDEVNEPEDALEIKVDEVKEDKEDKEVELPEKEEEQGEVKANVHTTKQTS